MSDVNEWNERLFGCCDDLGICCYGFWCSPCLFASNAKKLDGSNFCVNCCIFCALGQVYQSWLPHYFKRQKLRQKYNLREDSTCGDVAATLCCSGCALCQEARELKFRDHYLSENKVTDYQPTMSRVSYQQSPTSPTYYQPNYISRYSQDAYQSDVL